MTPTFDQLQKLLKQLPGLGARSAERIALHLLVEKPERMAPLIEALQAASKTMRRCARCGHLAESDSCQICSDTHRDTTRLCIVEQVPDLLALEKTSSYRGLYHVLHGKLSPINGVGEEQLNLSALRERLKESPPSEVILALSNDIEGEATCHLLQERYLEPLGIKTTRIGFGLPSGSALLYADAITLKNALEARRDYK